MTGIYEDTNLLKLPFVWIKDNSDTILIKYSNKLVHIPFIYDTLLIYINKGNHWYNKQTFRTESDFALDCACDTSTDYLIQHKYIYHDTILTYNYTTNYYGIQKWGEVLHIDTYNKIINIYLGNNFYSDVKNLFQELQNLACNYEKNMSIQQAGKNNSRNTYKEFRKIIRNDTLFLYEEINGGKQICLYDVRLLNSLGEFDPMKGESIMFKFQDHEQACK